MSHHGLTGPNIDRAAFVFDPEHPSKNNSDLLELRPLTRLLPFSGRDHARHAHGGMTGVDTSRVFFDPLGFRSRSFND
jgi:hypothetical protein